ncbi:hypothetical protein [Amycolatopsis sp. NPDC052450]|uniref:hypothetical protein n=1 Tax=Amycolatopsis sp. NPDC052450 TaxID=3363937 RepID=UPI0037CA85D6
MDPTRPARTSGRPIRAALTLAAAAAITVVADGTAHATVTATHGADWAQATSTTVRAYDGESDGNGVYADVYLTTGQHLSVWDGNGADGNAGPWAHVGGTIARFRVCEDHAGCSGWRYDPR